MHGIQHVNVNKFEAIDKVESCNSHPVTSPKLENFNSALILRWPTFLGKNSHDT